MSEIGRMAERQLMPWCQPHWDALREAIEARGMGPWVSRGGAMAAQQAGRELTGTQDDAKGFDPLMRAWSMINTRIMENGGSIWNCPLCEVQTHLDTCTQPGCSAEEPQAYIEGCADALLAYAREKGLVPKEPA